ncbi:spermidine/spermine N(1)-acetyltransferase [Croceitalea sp. MTPC9]|uniref:GNAT family N-acetyltransferase n=1 Tax=unclassified Croceitalea TaxID=2632280 RepID=UPI002B3B1E40|nr:spermidine/spermine N(1)-acetyltransferase [Croceitalea sp. MTPC6]GMN16517.1 spermidine/spermine N(1)-acetyltransferase [Croceitalea sp. MTPC9]
MKLRFQKCNEKDLNVLTKISKETFIDAFEDQNNPDDFQDYINKAFSISTLNKELNNLNSQFFFVYSNQKLIGYFKLNEFDAQSELKEAQGIELERIYIIKKHQGKSIGTQTLLEILKIARQKEKQYIWLGVWEHNLNAIRFYQKHGFIKFDKHPYYIGKDKQTDWLMRKEL